jgi:hypothetical protein
MFNTIYNNLPNDLNLATNFDSVPVNPSSYKQPGETASTKLQEQLPIATS